MFMAYSKLFADIVHSTIWREEMHVKIVWITMLAMSDRHGQVMSSIPGLADSSKVTLEQCLDALEVFKSPDEYSRTKDYEGRRVTEIDGGWLILNYEKFRARKDDEEQRIKTRERVRHHREKANSVTESVTVTSGNDIQSQTTESEVEAKSKPLSSKPDAKGADALVTTLCEFHRHIHGKTKSQTYGGKRRGAVGRFVREMRKAKTSDADLLAIGAQIIIGNTLSEHHQGTNDRGKVYDDIEMMFRDEIKIDNHVGYAHDAKVTSDIAHRELTGFLEGKPSRYAKSPKKTSPAASSERPEGLGADLTDAERSQYREFARLIAGFFASNVESKTILELCRENAELKEQGSGLVDGEYLDQTIQAAVKNFKSNGLSSALVEQIQKFANTFAKMEGMKK